MKSDSMTLRLMEKEGSFGCDNKCFIDEWCGFRRVVLF